jgi:hypothetical protein
MKVWNIIIVAALAVLATSFVFAAPKMNEYNMYKTDAPVSVVFQSIVPYRDLAPAHKQMVNKYQQILVGLPISREYGVKVVRSGIAPEAEGTTPIYFQTKNNEGMCEIIIMDVKKSGNFDYYYSTCQ